MQEICHKWMFFVQAALGFELWMVQGAPQLYMAGGTNSRSIASRISGKLET